MSSNKEKKKIFAQRARISQQKSEDKDKLSISRFGDKNKVYVSKKKIELQKRDKQVISKYEKSKEINQKQNSNVSNIYEQYQNNDPLSRFATGDDNKYQELSRKLNKESRKKINYKKDDEIENENQNQDNIDNQNENVNNNKKENKKIINNNDNKDNNDNSEDNKDKDERELNFSVQKQFQLAKQQYLKEKKEREEMFKQIQEKKEQTKKQIQQKKKEKFAVILKKTKKGQPIMANQMNKLLEKLQKNN